MFTSGLLFGVTVVGVGQWLLAFLALVAWTPMMAERLSHVDPRRVTAAGLNFYTGNNERASGLPARSMELRDVPQYGEGDARWLAECAVGPPLRPREGLAILDGSGPRGGSWGTPGDWFVVFGKKLLTLWNAFEIPDNYHYAFHALAFSAAALAADDVRAGGRAMRFWRRTDVTAVHRLRRLSRDGPAVLRPRPVSNSAVLFLIVFAAVAVERVLHALSARRWRSV